MSTYLVQSMLKAACMTKVSENMRGLRNKVEQEKLLDQLHRRNKSLRRGDTGYNPNVANWMLGDALMGSALMGGAQAYAATEKLRAMREDAQEKDPSKLRTGLYGALAGAGLGALAGRVATDGSGGALAGGGLGAVLGGLLGSSFGASQRIAARRAGLLRDPDDNTFLARTADRLLGGGGRLFMSQEPQYV